MKKNLFKVLYKFKYITKDSVLYLTRVTRRII